MSSYAFCQYSDIGSVVKAMRSMDGEHLGANRIKLGFGKSMPTSCVWVDGIGGILLYLLHFLLYLLFNYVLVRNIKSTVIYQNAIERCASSFILLKVTSDSSIKICKNKILKKKDLVQYQQCQNTALNILNILFFF